MNIIPKKMVCVFAHPDDEAFGPGGTIAFFAKNTEVHLVCVTCGGAAKKFSHTKNFGDSLGKIRREELKKSSEILGVKSVTFLDFIDGELNNNNYHEVAEKLQKILDGLKPDSLLTFNIDGVSGHLDHVAVAMEVSYLFEKLKYLKNLFYFVQNSKVKKKIGSKYFVYMPPGFSESEVDWVHNVEDFYGLKIKAMKAHKSQFKDYLMIKTFIGSLLKTEMFKVWVK